MPTRPDLPELEDLLPTAEIVDVRVARGAVSLREFTAEAVRHNPLWMKALYAVRMMLARVLRLDTPGIPDARSRRP